MATKKDLIGNELLNEIISIGVDTLWKMLALKKEGRLPMEYETVGVSKPARLMDIAEKIDTIQKNAARA